MKSIPLPTTMIPRLYPRLHRIESFNRSYEAGRLLIVVVITSMSGFSAGEEMAMLHQECASSIVPPASGAPHGAGGGGGRQRWFDDFGRLLPVHYTIVNQQIKEAMARIPELNDYPLMAPLEKRLAWAKAHRWLIGAMYQRCSSDMQDSYEGQIIESVGLALGKNIMVFPELVAGDEALGGRKIKKRPGFQLLQHWIGRKKMEAVVTFSVSRWARTLLKGLVFIQDEVVGNNLRAVAKAENFDTIDDSWKTFAALHLIVAEKQVESQSAFVRMGHKAKVQNGFLVGACPLGYYPKPVPELGFTKLGKPRTVPEKHPRVAPLVEKHYRFIADGMSLAEGMRRWNEEVATWPPEDRRYAIDPRATRQEMSAIAYRNLFERGLYRGRWVYGEFKSKWLSKKEYAVKEKAQPGEEVAVVREDLRIVSEELAERVQLTLGKLKPGHHGPRMTHLPPLESQLVPLFKCGVCGHHLTQYSRYYMRCPAPGHLCSRKGTVQRKHAIAVVIDALQREVLADTELVGEIVRQAQALDREDNGELPRRIIEAEKSLDRLKRQMSFMESAAGDGEDDAEAQQRYKELRGQFKYQSAELQRLRDHRSRKRPVITREAVEGIIARFSDLLRLAGDGKLDADGVTETAALIRLLTGGKITVTFEKHPHRNDQFGRGTFRPALADALRRAGDVEVLESGQDREIVVDFRSIPRYELLAEQVHRLHVEEGMNLCAIGRRLNCGDNVAYRAFQFWYTSRGEEPPALPLGIDSWRPRPA